METIRKNSLTFLDCFCKSLTEYIRKLQQVIYNSHHLEEEYIQFIKKMYGNSCSDEDCIKLAKKSREVDPSVALKNVSECEQEIKYINELIRIINSTKDEITGHLNKDHLNKLRSKIDLSDIKNEDRKYIKTKYNDSIIELYILNILYNKVSTLVYNKDSKLDNENCRNYINDILLKETNKSKLNCKSRFEFFFQSDENNNHINVNKFTNRIVSEMFVYIDHDKNITFSP